MHGNDLAQCVEDRTPARSSRSEAVEVDVFGQQIDGRRRAERLYGLEQSATEV